MPTRKPRRTRPQVSPKISVRLDEKDRTCIGMTLLAIMDGPARTTALSDLERVLGLWASARANVPHILLRSDTVSWAEPVAVRARTLARVVRTLDRDIKTLASILGFVNFAELRRQITGLNTFVAWVKKEAPKGGGERRTLHKQVNDFWSGFVGEWFDRHAMASPTAIDERRAQFLRIAQRAVNRELEKHTLSR